MRWPPTFCLRYKPFVDQTGLLDGLNVQDGRGNLRPDLLNPVGKGGDDDKLDDVKYTIHIFKYVDYPP